MSTSESLQWRKSSHCSNGTCVEVAKHDGQYLVRDSKNPNADPLTFTTDEWSAFVQGINEGQFIF
ncbi:DUF397 domain-containing protein [Actinoplanes auranticolor]|uniref:DUF397 domain-containing protein n=1 Tax=Actinoplanes auranticolor TaxID=47988 RepID=A0A919VW35_9ACTN|nr:DUF397 domain-containing protein [Actinoplanes auranticolor]GIM77937.1 hypothetical protein Aau02nite_78390 [Actinoplanes auranticolor]